MVRKTYNVTTPEDLWESYQHSGESRNVTTAINSKGKKQLWLLVVPLLDVSVINLSLITCYIIGLARNNIKPLTRVPFISELGSTPPQSYIFTFGMASTSFTTFLIVFFRYKQVSFSRAGNLNTISALFGNLGAISKLMLGAFQYHPRYKWLHYSAFISFIFFSYLFIGTQVFLTHNTKTISSTATLLTRLVLALLLVVFAVLFCTFILPSLRHMNNSPYNVAQSAQWIYWVLLNIYTLTFVIDFVRIRISWNVRQFPNMQGFTIAESVSFLANSREMNSMDSIDDPETNMSRGSSVAASLTREVPREFTTMV